MCGCNKTTNGITMNGPSRPGVFNGLMTDAVGVLYVGSRVGAANYYIGTMRYAFGGNPMSRASVMPLANYEVLMQCCAREFIQIPVNMAGNPPDLSQTIVATATIEALTDTFKAALISSGITTIGQVLTYGGAELANLLTTDEASALTLQNEIRQRFGLPLVDVPMAPVTPTPTRKAKTTASQ